MKNSLNKTIVIFRGLALLTIGIFLTMEANASFPGHTGGELPTSFVVSIQYETESEEMANDAEDATEAIEYETQESDENLAPEEEYIEQEGEEEYILIDEDGNVIDEETLFEETGQGIEEGFEGEGGEYIYQNEEGGIVYEEEGEVLEEGEPGEEEYEVIDEQIEQEELYEQEQEDQAFEEESR